MSAEALSLKTWGRSDALTGTVRVTSSVIVANLCCARCPRFRIAQPTIRIEVVASDVNQNLLRRDADIATRMSDPTQDRLIARKLGEAPVVCMERGRTSHAVGV